jgi:hypothetical protein
MELKTQRVTFETREELLDSLNEIIQFFSKDFDLFSLDEIINDLELRNEELIESIIKKWISKDTFYTKYALEILHDDDNFIDIISIAVE